MDVRLPSAKLSHDYGISPYLMGKFTINVFSMLGEITGGYPWLSYFQSTPAEAVRYGKPARNGRCIYFVWHRNFSLKTG